jgi:hypothetical protein
MTNKKGNQKTLTLNLSNMKKVKLLTALFSAFAVLVIGCDNNDDDDYTPPPPPPVQSTVVSAVGDSATVLVELNKFRIILGDPVNNTPNQTVGRREVNWDGVPAQFSNNNPFPLDFFNSTDPAVTNGRKRGLQYLDNGTQFRVDSTDFKEIDASYEAQFQPFTGRRQIVATGTNISDVVFKIPGTATDASVKGFGVMFIDVDNANSTFIEFFNGAKSLGVFKAPAAAGSAKYSFLGVHFPTEKITRLKITCGNAALAAGVKDITTDANGKDLVTMDDFFYSEPVTQ